MYRNDKAVAYSYDKTMVEKDRTDASAAHSTLRERVQLRVRVPRPLMAATALDLGLVDDGRARRLDGGWRDRRATTNGNITLYDDAERSRS